MAIMQEAMDKENFERWEKGLPPLKRKKVERPEPKRPEVENEIKFDDIPVKDFVELKWARRKTLRNSEGVRFIGFDVTIILNPGAQIKRKPGRPAKEEEIPSEPKILSGWMDEGNFLRLCREMREKINQQVISW